MKVLFTTNIPSPYRVNFFNELSKYCDLTVTFENEKVAYREKEWLNRENQKFNAIFLKKVFNKFICYGKIKKLIKENNYDIIVVGGYSTITGMRLIQFLRRKKIKFVLNADGGIIKENENKILYKIKKHFISSATYWLSTGKNTSDYLKYYGAKAEKIYVYPFTSTKEEDIVKNVIEASEKEKIKEELKIKEKLNIIAIGQFIPRKGFDILIKATKLLKENIGVHIIGGNVTDEYLKITQELKLNNVHFIGFKPKEELKKYYKMADIFVLPTREDVWGLVINEAMAFGLPVITTNKCVAGLELIENNKNGFIFQVDNVNELADDINKIINNENLKLNMSKNNIEKIKKYTIENMAKEHINIFKKIINEG